MNRFEELKTFPADVRAFYESFIRDGERIESDTMEMFLKAGDVRLFASKTNDGRFVMANFVAVATLFAAPIMLQSYMILDEQHIDEAGQAEHMVHVLATLHRDYPGARLLFEGRELGDYQSLMLHGEPQLIWGDYKMPDLVSGVDLDAHLWAYPTGADDTFVISEEQVAEWVYVLQRVCYQASEEEATRIVAASKLPVGQLEKYEAAVSGTPEPQSTNWRV